MGKKKQPPAPPRQTPFHNPFEGLAGKLGELPPGPAAPGPTERAGPARAVIRYERKGHGGKEITVVEQLELSAADLERWLKEARKHLGCGGSVQEGALVLQGDQRPRLKRWLEARGVRRISVG